MQLFVDLVTFSAEILNGKHFVFAAPENLNKLTN